MKKIKTKSYLYILYLVGVNGLGYARVEGDVDVSLLLQLLQETGIDLYSLW